MRIFNNLQKKNEVKEVIELDLLLNSKNQDLLGVVEKKESIEKEIDNSKNELKNLKEQIISSSEELNALHKKISFYQSVFNDKSKEQYKTIAENNNTIQKQNDEIKSCAEFHNSELELFENKKKSLKKECENLSVQKNEILEQIKGLLTQKDIVKTLLETIKSEQVRTDRIVEENKNLIPIQEREIEKNKELLKTINKNRENLVEEISELKKDSENNKNTIEILKNDIKNKEKEIGEKYEELDKTKNAILGLVAKEKRIDELVPALKYLYEKAGIRIDI